MDLIENKGVTQFYVGNHGGFDGMVHRILKELVKVYPIQYDVVLAYMPGNKSEPNEPSPEDTVLPEGIEKIPSKYAILRRNQWMLKQADYVVTYVAFSTGGAAQFKELAHRQKKIVINLG